MTAKNAKAGARDRSLTALWAATAIALVIVSFFWAGGRRRHTGDTWIGLAAGRLICERLSEGGLLDWQSRFPLEDEFTFTFAGKVWTNQNWLTHVIYWLLYDNWSPGALVVWKLFLVAVMGVAMWHGALLITRSQPISVLAACIGSLVAGEYVDIRPNHLGFVCVAVLFWLLLLVKYGRGWAVWLIPVLMTFWGNAHGSFLFGFAMLVGFSASEAFQRLISWRTRLTSWRHLAWLGVAGVVSFLLVLVTSPYGWSNFTHPFVIMTGKNADVFQGVMEWRPPDPREALPAGFPFAKPPLMPKVGGFWVLLLASAVVWVWAALSRRRLARTGDRSRKNDREALFDFTLLGLTAVGVYLALGSRRFIPVFVVLSVPMTAKLLAGALREIYGARTKGRAAHADRPLGQGVLAGAALVNALLLVWFGGLQWMEYRLSYFAKNDEPYGMWIFKTHTTTPGDLVAMIDFVNGLGIGGPIFNEWTYGGYLMFNAPQLKLYIDGRSQALFTAEFYKNYWRLMRRLPTEGSTELDRGLYLDGQLAELGTDLVLVKRGPAEVPQVIMPLLRTGRWEPLFEARSSILLIRAVSTRLETVDLMRRYWTGELDWPDTTYGWRIRAHIWQRGEHPDPERALVAFRRAIELRPEGWLYEAMAQSWQQTGRLREALAYYQGERERVTGMVERGELEQATADKCIDALNEILARFEQGGS